MIEDLLPVLAAGGLHPDVRELCDALWLSSYVRTDASGGVDRTDTAPGRSANSHPGPQKQDGGTGKGAGSARTTLHTRAPGGGEAEGAMADARGPAVPALRHQLELARALRPFKRRVPNPDAFLIDEEATAVRVAEERLWIPVLRPAPRRWLHLTLVVDASATMVLWHRTVAELRSLTEHMGAFRTVRVVQLHAGTEREAPVRLYPEGDTWPQRHEAAASGERGSEAQGDVTVSPQGVGPGGRDPISLMTGGGQQTVLVVTDAVGAPWHDGRMEPVLRGWATDAPLAVVTVLPQRMWAGTGLRAVPAGLRSRGPGAANAAMEVYLRTGTGTARRSTGTDIPVPVVELSERWLAGWADVVAGVPGPHSTALLVPAQAPVPPALGLTGTSGTPHPPAVSGTAPSEHGGPSVPVDPAAVVGGFRAASSATAFRLACCLSAAWLNLPVMRLVQHVMLPESDTGHLAEVYLGGLLSRHPAVGADCEQTYDFLPGVRAELNQYLTRRDLVRILEQTSAFVSEHFGQPLDFPALLADPERAALPVRSGGGPPLAYVAASVLAQLGSRYRVLAERLPNAIADASTLGTGAAPESLGTRGAAVIGDVGFENAPTVTVPRPRPDEHVRPVPPPVSSRRHVASDAPYFFLSYARTPSQDAGTTNPNLWVEHFYQDLCDHILSLTDLPYSQVGFIDRDIQTGEGWSDRLAEALATCRVFVPLMSPRYFASPHCGKEWFAFQQRAIQHQARSGRPAQAIVPALWVPVTPEQTPSPAEQLQFNHAAFGAKYTTDGLYGLIKLTGLREEYEVAVYELARHIVKVAESSEISPGQPVDYQRIPSAFGTPRGSRNLRITVAAATRHHLPPARNARFYGDRAVDWNPFHPATRRPLAAVAAELAAGLDYHPTVVSLDEEPDPQLAAGPEVLLVDPWSALDPDQRERLGRPNVVDRPWTVVVVPWNPDDSQSAEREEDLVDALGTMLHRKMQEGPAFIRRTAHGVHSMRSFTDVLPAVIDHAASQFLRAAHP